MTENILADSSSPTIAKLLKKFETGGLGEIGVREVQQPVFLFYIDGTPAELFSDGMMVTGPREKPIEWFAPGAAPVLKQVYAAIYDAVVQAMQEAQQQQAAAEHAQAEALAQAMAAQAPPAEPMTQAEAAPRQVKARLPQKDRQHVEKAPARPPTPPPHMSRTSRTRPRGTGSKGLS